jgi:hypothetical protein
VIPNLHDFGFLGQGHYAHGTRQNYQSGCKCTPCRVANASYAAHRAQTDTAGWVNPDDARAYLLTLQDKGVGYRQAAELSGVSASTIKAIRAGARTRILQSHHVAILSIPPYPAMGQRVSSKRAKHLLHSLQGEGFTLRDVAAKLGLRRKELTLHPTVTVKKSLQVHALWRKLTAENEASA